MLVDESLTQFFYTPMFIQSDVSFKNTLEYITSYNCRRVVNLVTGSPLGNTKQAHVTLYWEFLLACEPSQRFSSIKYNLNKGEYAAIRADLTAIDWPLLLKNKDFDASYESFLSIYHNLCDKFISSSNSKIRAQWISTEVRLLSRKKTSLWHKVLRPSGPIPR